MAIYIDENNMFFMKRNVLKMFILLINKVPCVAGNHVLFLSSMITYS